MGWTEKQLRDYTTKRLRDEQRTRTKLYEASNPMAGLQDSVSERDDRPPLVKKAHRAHRCDNRVKVRVSIISCRQRLLDSDNLVAGSKQLRDAIAEFFGCDDAEGSGIEWEYSQCLTRGRKGTIVKIEQL